MKNAVVVLLNNYADWEAGYLTGILNQRKDWQVKVASNQKTITSIGGVVTEPDQAVAEAGRDSKIDLLILIGGKSWTLEDSNLKKLIKDQLDNQLPLAAICGSVDFLAKNGFLNNYQHTGNAQYLWRDFPEYQNQAGFLKKQAVRDRNLVTANGTAALDFTELTLGLIGDHQADAKRAVDLYRLGFYDYFEKYGNPF